MKYTLDILIGAGSVILTWEFVNQFSAIIIAICVIIYYILRFISWKRKQKITELDVQIKKEELRKIKSENDGK